MDDLQQQIDTLTNDWKRALADYQNLVKRVETDKREIVKFASINLITRLLPTLDILELAATHSKDSGIIMAVKQFQDVLRDEGLQAIEPKIGDQFNHEVHDCLETLPGDLDKTIAEVVYKGYKIEDVVLRPAKVKVWQKS
ncbi:MAG: nucleotide exchange factor GrpE [Patescibacteria group bacterium]